MDSLRRISTNLATLPAALAGNEIWQEKAYLPGMAAIATGVLTALLASQFRPRRGWFLYLLQLLGATGMLAVFCFERFLWSFLGNGTLLMLTLSAAALVLSFYWGQSDSPAKSIPCTGWLQSFGRLSYEIYLTHMFVVFAIVRVFKWSGTGLWLGILWYVPALVFSWILGWLVAEYFSIPAERFMRQRLIKSI